MNRCFLAALLATTFAAAEATPPEEEDTTAKFQATYVWHTKPSFDVPYSGPNSLGAQHEKGYSFTATAFLGLRLLPATELYVNPEVARGVPFSQLLGLGGFNNGEAQRGSSTKMKLYAARVFVRQAFGMGGGTEAVESDQNQLAGSVDKRRIVITAGKIALGDLFEDNAYSHDPRVDFLNWSLFNHGAYDFASDARGYTVGAAAEYFDPAGWAVRFGRFAMPRESNSLPLDTNFNRQHGDQAELELPMQWGERKGKVRLLAYRNVANMGGYREALDLAAATGGTPDLTLVRASHAKTGYGVNVEQEILENTGVFFRASRNNGRWEEFAFAEIDESVNGGVVVKGVPWGRPEDKVGIAFGQNGISTDHRAYLAAGGLGFFVGDGALRYSPERVMEALYSAAVGKFLKVSLDYQRIWNPAYNADRRGPVDIFTARLHTEF